MPTKLKTPIVITITHVENAVMTVLKSANSFNPESNERHSRIRESLGVSEVGEQIEKGLQAQGIDCCTWQPPTPLRAGSYDVEILADGSIKVGCQNVTNDQFEAIVKARGEVVKGKEEWPQFWRNDNDAIIQLNNPNDYGVWLWTKCGTDIGMTSYCVNLNHCQENSARWKKLTRAEASKILGREV